MTAPYLAPVVSLTDYLPYAEQRGLASAGGLSVFLPRGDENAVVGSPLWWRDALLRKLFNRWHVQRLDKWERYYCGRFDLPWVPPHQHDVDFLRVLEMCRANVMGLVVDATAERYGVTGFRFGDDDRDRAVLTARQAAAAADEVDPLDLAFIGDADAWALWQRNGMDAQFPAAIHDSVKLGSGWLMTAPNPADRANPCITREDPTQVAVAHQPGWPRGIAAGIKAWQDEWTAQLFVTLFLPDSVYKWTSRDGRWVERTVAGETWPAPNPVGEVPLYELPNYPNRVSEIDDVTPDQDRINKTLVDRIMDQDYGAFPAKWGIGFPAEDKDGNPTKIEWGRNRMLTNDVGKDQAAFGQFAAAPLDPYIAAKEADVRDVAARKRIPAQYLLGTVANVTGSTLKAAEVGLVAKTLVGQYGRGEGLEDAMRAAFRLAGDDQRGRAYDAETIWRNPEFRTEGELVDALTKMATLGVPREALWERWGATPQEIRRWRRMANDAAQRGGLGDLTALVTGQAQPQADTAAGLDVAGSIGDPAAAG